MELVIRPIEPEDIGHTARVWHESKQSAYWCLPLQQGITPEEDERIFREHVLPGFETWIATLDGEIVAFLTLDGSYVARLYVHPARQGSGVGTALLAHAKQTSPLGLELHTHQKNAPAREFTSVADSSLLSSASAPPPRTSPTLSTTGARVQPCVK